MSTKSFSSFDLIWCVGRTPPNVHTRMTSTRSKVKVTELLKLRKLYFSMSISSTVAWSSKLMNDYDTMGPILQLVGAQFLNFLLSKLSCDFKLLGMSLLQTRAAWFGMLVPVVLYVLCMLIWPDTRSRLLSFWSSENFQKLHFSRSISQRCSLETLVLVLRCLEDMKSGLGLGLGLGLDIKVLVLVLVLTKKSWS